MLWKKVSIHASLLLIEISFGIIKICAFGLLQFLLRKHMKQISSNTFNIGHHGSSFKAIKIPNEIPQWNYSNRIRSRSDSISTLGYIWKTIFHWAFKHLLNKWTHACLLAYVGCVLKRRNKNIADRVQEQKYCQCLTSYKRSTLSSTWTDDNLHNHLYSKTFGFELRFKS